MPSNRTVNLRLGDAAAVRRASPRDPARAPGPDNFFFFHNQLSKDHAEFTHTSDGLQLADTGSSFGTLLNNQFVVPHHAVGVASGDEVGFIVVKSVRFLEDVVQRHEGPLIPLAEFNNPRVMLRFKVETFEEDGSLVLALQPVGEDAQDSFFRESEIDLMTVDDSDDEQGDISGFAVVLEDDDDFDDDDFDDDEELDSESHVDSEDYSFDEEYEYDRRDSDVNDDSLVRDCGGCCGDETNSWDYSDDEISGYRLPPYPEYNAVFEEIERQAARKWYKTFLKEALKASVYVVGTIIALGVYGSQQQQQK